MYFGNKVDKDEVVVNAVSDTLMFHVIIQIFFPITVEQLSIFINMETLGLLI